jgi:ribonucleoside-diphosphate reductase alpha chain
MDYCKVSNDVWDKKYRLKDNKSISIDEDRDANFVRVATALAPNEEERKAYLWALRNGAVPAGRIMGNAGAQEHKPNTSLINCTVSNIILDNIESIMDSNKNIAILLKYGCGVGSDYSNIRPNGAYIKGAGAQTSGLIPFMSIIDKTCESIASAGGRRGALMATLDIRHPEILNYITAKRQDGKLRQFNLSVLITDDFMQKVKNKEEHKLVFPLHKGENQDVEWVWDYWPSGQYDDNYIKNDLGQVKCKVYNTVNASDLYDTIMKSTYEFSEPGFINIDTYNKYNPLSFIEDIRATNPC